MRPLMCEIRLHHLKNNYLALKQWHGGKLLAVVKADAYGHGAIPCARALHDIADGFAVAYLDEAIELRENGITKPIVLLEGVFDASEYAQVEQYHLWPVVHQQSQLESLLAYPWQKPVDVWLKMDSGMHRAGFFPHHFAAAHHALAQSPKVGNIVKMTHFANADSAEPYATQKQTETFDLASAHLTGETSLANSAAILAHPNTHRHWGRAGIALYGASPLPPDSSGSLKIKLQPVMRLSTRIFAERVLQAHEPIGYGATFHTQHATRVGLAACGYGDGYPRLAGTGTPVAINGERTRIIGRISMDMLTVDLYSNHAGVGSEVELWGDTVHVNEVAAAAGTIAYEILCHIKRAQRVYSDIS